MRSAAIPISVAILATTVAFARAADGDSLTFDKDIMPILRQHCVSCHGQKPKRGGLDVSTAAGLLAGSDSGPVLVKGSSAKSVLFEKVEGRTMPPPEKKDRLSDADMGLLKQWIDDGAKGMEAVKIVALPKERVVTDQDRAFWAFRKPVAAPFPRVRGADRVRTPVDAFLLAKLEGKGLGFSPDAAKAVLLRRAYLDLIGLPPTPDEVRSFLADPAPDAYERVIDRLLDSPHYGERWGRHWLDVAGYTDSPHCDTQGAFLPVEDWLYRDYVVRAFNQDKPYDRFLIEQLAGDEVVNWRLAKTYTPEIRDALVATGYLRTTPDWTHGDQFQTAYRNDTMARVVENVSTGLLGLTMGCVRCHTHKFDPIPHEDYYRLMAVFATAYNPEAWLRPHERYLPDISPAEKAPIDKYNAEVDARKTEVAKQLDALRGPHRKKLFAAKLATLPKAIQADVETALAIPAAKRDEVQRYLAEKFESSLAVSDAEVLKSYSVSERAQADKLSGEFGALLSKKKTFGRLQVLWDVGQPPLIHQLLRGDVRTPGRAVEPGYITVLCPPGEAKLVPAPDVGKESSGRRLAFARWLTSRDHPLTARVMVNRVWQHHFGKGIVATPENFGRSGVPPTHSELLDWLAVDFMEHGWSLKRLHRLLMTSTAYRQSAHRPAEGNANKAAALDPENELLWRMNLRRLEAEAMRDTVLAVSGQLDRTMGGAPIPVQSNPDGLVVVTDKGPTATSKFRRSLYIRSLRGSHPTGVGFRLSMFELFDFPEVVINCTRRANSTTPLQSLALINSSFMLEQARHFAERVRGLASEKPKQIETAFLLAYGRLPTRAETTFCLEYRQTQEQVFRQSKMTDDQAAQRALAGLCSVLLASNEFLYIG